MPTSPTSPGVDQTSFYARAKSPEDIGGQDVDAAEDIMDGEHEEGSVHDDDLDEGEDMVGGLGGEILDPRLSRISVSLPLSDDVRS